MSAPCSRVTAATPVTTAIALPPWAFRGTYDSGEQQACRAELVAGRRGPVAPAQPQGGHGSLREGRGAPAAACAPPAPGVCLCAWAARGGPMRPGLPRGESGEAREPGAALPCPARLCLAPTRAGSPAQVRPRRPEPRPPAGRGLARPGPPAAPRPLSPAGAGPEPRQGECPAVRGGDRPGPRGGGVETMPGGRPAPPLPRPRPAVG